MAVLLFILRLIGWILLALLVILLAALVLPLGIRVSYHPGSLQVRAYYGPLQFTLWPRGGAGNAPAAPQPAPAPAPPAGKPAATEGEMRPAATAGKPSAPPAAKAAAPQAPPEPAAAPQPGGAKPSAELYALHGGNAEDNGGDAVFHAAEHGVPQSGG